MFVPRLYAGILEHRQDTLSVATGKMGQSQTGKQGVATS